MLVQSPDGPERSPSAPAHRWPHDDEHVEAYRLRAMAERLIEIVDRYLDESTPDPSPADTARVGAACRVAAHALRIATTTRAGHGGV